MRKYGYLQCRMQYYYRLSSCSRCLDIRLSIDAPVRPVRCGLGRAPVREPAQYVTSNGIVQQGYYVPVNHFAAFLSNNYGKVS